MWIQQIVLGILGLSAGITVAGGLFSFIIELGILADFADRTHTGDNILLYEDAAALGGALGNLFFVYQIPLPGGAPCWRSSDCWRGFLPGAGPWPWRRC